MIGFSLEKNRNGVVWLKIPKFEKTGMVLAAFTTRIGGCSTGRYESLNLGINTGDQREFTDKNFQKVKRALSLDDTVSLYQIHSDIVIEIKKCNVISTIGRFIYDQGDALVTDDPGIALITYHADCIPVYFLDVKKRVVGLAHSGWKGTASQIAVKTVEKMQALYNSRPCDIMAAVGPGIDFCCFETGKEVFDVFHNQLAYEKVFFKKLPNEKYQIDLKGIIKNQLKSKGLQDIEMSSSCTMCQEDLFFSYRRDKGDTGRMAAILQLL